MPEREFELYLDLLARLLRLRPEQRAEIADELRDHLEARLDELTAAGLSREAAVRRALEEFGDAAGLASHFTNIAREKRRRMIMRCTLGTVAVTTVVLLALSAFWPQDAAINLPARVAAQDTAERLIDAIEGQERDESIPRVEAKLEKRIEVDFTENPLEDVVEAISQAIEVDILLNRKSLEDVGVQTDIPVTLTIRHTTVAARTVLDVVLEQFDLGYVIRDGFIYILSAEDAAENHYIEVYNVRDLVEDVGHGPAPQTAAMVPRVPVQTVQFGGGGGFGGEGFGGGQHEPPTPETPGQRLIGVIESTVGVPWENIDGVGGTIEEFQGLLVIRTSREGHREIKELLEMMRTAGEKQPPRAGAAGGRTAPRRSGGETPLPSEPGATPLPTH